MSVKKALLIIMMLCASAASWAQSVTMVSIKPLAMIHNALLPDISVEILLPSNKNLHDYALSVGDMRRLKEASVFFWLGDHNEHFLIKLEKRFAKDAQWYALAANSDHIWLDPAKQSQLVEAMAQASGILGFQTLKKQAEDDSLYLLAGIDDVRFKRQVVPGDRLQLEARVVSEKRGIWKFECKASVDGELAATATILCAHRKV